MLIVCYKLPYHMDGQYKVDSGDKYHLPMEGPRLTNDKRTHKIFLIIYISLIWNVTGKV